MFTRRLFLLGMLAACAAPEQTKMPTGTRLILLRHAERNNLNLTKQGRARAKLLVHVLADVHIDAIYSPRLKRNLDTVLPLAAARGLNVRYLPTDNPTAQLMADGAGTTIVWVGNKGNIASIWKALNISGSAPMAHADLHFIDTTRFGRPKATSQDFSL
tara:strand:+ start:979 stop:1455 length:477 start_codon:yes stop_codon:yes gene_type:complete